MIPFAAYTADSLNAIQWAGQPQKLPLPMGICAPSNTWFLGHMSQTHSPK